MRVIPAIGGRLMTRVLVVPVDNVDRAVGSPAQVDRPEILIAGSQEVRGAACDEGRAVGPEHVALDARAVDAAHEDAAPVILRDVIAFEYEEAGVRPAALLVM